MALEGSFNTIDDLVITNPEEGDTRTQGDDHLRGIKKAIKGSFTDIGSTPVSATGTQLNYVASVTPGTAAANKAVVLDGAKGIATITSATITTMTGNVTGNVTGDLTGNVTGDLTGNVTATSVLADGVTATTQTEGDNDTSVATTAYADNAAIGWNQTWQNVAGSRVIGDTYRNTTGKPIMVSVTVQVAESANTYAYVGLATPPTLIISEFEAVSSNANVDDFRFTHSFIVPDDHYYRIVTGTEVRWLELR